MPGKFALLTDLTENRATIKSIGDYPNESEAGADLLVGPLGKDRLARIEDGVTAKIGDRVWIRTNRFVGSIDVIAPE